MQILAIKAQDISAAGSAAHVVSPHHVALITFSCNVYATRPIRTVKTRRKS